MHDGSLGTRREPGTTPRAPGVRPLVSILLVAAAIFLVVLILARSPLQGYVISQRVQAAADRASTATPLATEQVGAWLKADAVLAATVQQVCPHDSLAVQNNVVHDLRRGLEVQPLEHAAVRPGWQLSLQHQDRQLASRLLGKLAESLAAQLRHLDQAETQLLVQHHQKILAQLRDEEDSARLALERARHEQLALATQQAPRTAPAKPTAASKETNPALLELRQRVAEAQAKLEQLLAARTMQHPQVIEAQARLSQLQEQLNGLPAEQSDTPESKTQPAPTLQGPQLQKATHAQPRVTVRLISSADEHATGEVPAVAKELQTLTLQWTSATARRAAAERSYNEAQQQWVRGLNAKGWEAEPVFVQAQQGGHTTPFQLLLAGSLALVGAVGTWRLTQIAGRAGLLVDVPQLQGTLPLPVLGQVPLTTVLTPRMPEHLGRQLSRLAQLSLAVVAAVALVCAWASTSDPNLSGQWTSDPFSAVGQAFDLLHHRVAG